MNIIFSDAISEAMYVATRRSDPATKEFFSSYFENMMWSYAPKPNWKAYDTSDTSDTKPPVTVFVVIIGNPNDLWDRDDTDNPVSREFAWGIQYVDCDKWNKLLIDPTKFGASPNRRFGMNGGLINHGTIDEPRWSVHT